MNLGSGYPFWLVRYGLPFDYPALKTDINTDVLIMGGGISGALVSYYLTDVGIENIVTDARTIGLGSTCASTSLLQYEIDTPLCDLIKKVGKEHAVNAYRLCSDAIDSLENIAVKINFSDFERRQSLYYGASKKDVKFLEREFKVRKDHGFDVKYLHAEDIKNQFDFSSPAAILSAQGAQTNAYLFAHYLHQYSIKKGAKVFDRTCIETISHSETGVKLTTKEGHTINARKLVYASGYESIKYINKKIVDLKSTFAVCSDQGNDTEAPFKNKAMLWNTADPYLYLRTTADNRILIGGRDEKFYSTDKRDKALQAKVKDLVKDFTELYPDITFKPEFSWCGTFGATKDGLPFIGEYAKLPNSYFALGFGGNGITFSLIAAEILKDLILGKKNIHQEIFSFNRV